MLRIGVIGYGYWGPNIVRNFSSTPDAAVVAVCDKNPEALARLGRGNPGIRLESDCDTLLRAPDIDAVCIITPVSSHYPIAKKALENGKHVFVEKPFTQTIDQARELVDLAASKNLRFMVDHTFLFTGAVRKIKDLISRGELGDILYYDSVRVNLGLFQHDVNVIWDLAPHDFAIMLYLLDQKPTAIIATGQPHFNTFEDIAYVTVYFESNLLAHFHVNWLSPVKVRNTFIGGMKKSLVWNDVIADDKIKIYDKGIDVSNREGIYDLLVSYRSGDMWAPRLDTTEALKLECRHFVEAVANGADLISDGAFGLEVVRLLQACDESLNNSGKLVSLIPGAKPRTRRKVPVHPAVSVGIDAVQADVGTVARKQ